MTSREQEVIRMVEFFGGDQSKAADVLEISISTVLRHVRAVSNGGCAAEKRKRHTNKKLEVRPHLLFSDPHAPFQHKRALEFLEYCHGHYNCHEHVYCLGDLHDCHQASDYETELDAMSPDDEYAEAIKFSADLCDLFPSGTLVEGNHCKRYKRLLRKGGVTLNVLKNDAQLYGLSDGWTVERQYAVLKDTKLDMLIQHGDGSNGVNGAINTALKKGSSFAQGHTHFAAGVAYRACHFDLKFGVNCGCLCDDTSYALRYGVNSGFKGVLGCTLVYPSNGIVNAHAVFIPMDAGE